MEEEKEEGRVLMKLPLSCLDKCLHKGFPAIVPQLLAKGDDDRDKHMGLWGKSSSMLLNVNVHNNLIFNN